MPKEPPMRRHRALAALSMAVLLAGCTSTALELAPERPDRPWRPNTDADGAILPGAAASAPAAIASTYVLPANTALGTLPPPAPSIDAEHVYALPELIDIAQQNNPETRIAWNLARDAALAAGIAKATYLPYVSASVVGGHS